MLSSNSFVHSAISRLKRFTSALLASLRYAPPRRKSSFQIFTNLLESASAIDPSASRFDRLDATPDELNTSEYRSTKALSAS